jgi:hypothetical protein
VLISKNIGCELPHVVAKRGVMLMLLPRPGSGVEKVKDQPWNEPREKDRRAGRWIKEIGALASAKV